MSGFLEQMAAASRARVERARAAVPEAALRAQALAAPRPPPLPPLGAFEIIAELKLRSPAAGTLARSEFDRTVQLDAYAAGGAAAVSVLTEPAQFHGSLEYLAEAAARLGPAKCPAMRKDFLVDPYQVLEARAAGASGVLVIVTMLDDDTVRALVDCAAEHGLFVLLEGFDRADLERIAAHGTRSDTTLLAGVNCRDLRTLAVDFERFEALAPHLPRGLPTVAESGVGSEQDVRRVAALGDDLALIGSALMSAGDPRATLERFLAAGRGSAAASAGERSCS